MVLRRHVELHSSLRDNLRSTQDSREARFYKGCRGCGKLSDVLDFKWYATRISMICIGYFQRNLGMSFLCVTTSGALAVKYWMGVLAHTDIYSADNIACQHDMSKIALQSANDRLKLNSINRIYKLLNIKVGIYFLG